jgi:hypothetical protein
LDRFEDEQVLQKMLGTAKFLLLARSVLISYEDGLNFLQKYKKEMTYGGFFRNYFSKASRLQK